MVLGKSMVTGPRSTRGFLHSRSVRKLTFSPHQRGLIFLLTLSSSTPGYGFLPWNSYHRKSLIPIPQKINSALLLLLAHPAVHACTLCQRRCGLDFPQAVTVGGKESWLRNACRIFLVQLNKLAGLSLHAFPLISEWFFDHCRMDTPKISKGKCNEDWPLPKCHPLLLKGFFVFLSWKPGRIRYSLRVGAKSIAPWQWL